MTDEQVERVARAIWRETGTGYNLWDYAGRDYEVIKDGYRAFARAAIAAIPAQEAGEARLFLDLDGVMADFDAHFPDVFGLDHKGLADDEMWLRINSHPTYFLDMPLCDGAKEFFDEVECLGPIILTACPRTNYTNAAQQKRQWVRNNLSETATVLPVMGGHNKWLFMHAAGDILIDDYQKNVRPWRKAGGVGIHHTSFQETRAALRALTGGPDNG